MIDTSPAMNSKFYQLIMAKSKEERLLMGCSMFDTAKQIVKNAIANHNPGITSQTMRKEIFLRFYGKDFNKAEKQKILNVLR
ncbi:MAG: hypothetical protein U9Q24_00060 [Candidatus Ratteibacteria bacterium]|nr:hypothetical protein [Candidatus Ratteibacteria bacterium]